jgi:hypothetical protein
MAKKPERKLVEKTYDRPADPNYVPAREGGGKWKKGFSGNPRGKPKGSVSLVALIRRRLEENPEMADKLVDQLLGLGKKKNYKQLEAIKELLDRVDGRVTEKHKIESDQPATIIFVPAGSAPKEASNTTGEEDKAEENSN